MDTDEALSAAAPSSATESDVNMQDAKGAANAPGSENDAQEGDLPAQMETDAKVRTKCFYCSRRFYAQKQNTYDFHGFLL